MSRPSERKLIYVKGGQDYQYTVYEKVGYGNKPRTQEDLDREAEEFREFSKQLAGGEGGKASDLKDGDGKGASKDGASDKEKGKGK
jgi:hypothetical protein